MTGSWKSTYHGSRPPWRKRDSTAAECGDREKASEEAFFGRRIRADFHHQNRGCPRHGRDIGKAVSGRPVITRVRGLCGIVYYKRNLFWRRAADQNFPFPEKGTARRLGTDGGYLVCPERMPERTECFAARLCFEAAPRRAVSWRTSLRV